MRQRRYFRVHVQDYGIVWVSETRSGERRIHSENGTAWPLDQKQPTPGIPLDQAIQDAWGRPIRVTFGEPPLLPGRFYPRIWRPGAPPLGSRHDALRNEAAHAARVRFARLREVFQFIEPRGKNLRTYGHATRDLLVLACTEIETAWKGVLRENGYRRLNAQRQPVPERYWNAERDYVHLNSIMRLSDWEVSLVGHAGVKPMRPFRGWAPSHMLPWYQAYNAVKHDREKDFAKATLKHCIEALAGLFVMFYAQFGSWTLSKVWPPVRDFESVAREAIYIDTFRLADEPEWEHAERYSPPALTGRPDADWTPQRFW